MHAHATLQYLHAHAICTCSRDRQYAPVEIIRCRWKVGNFLNSCCNCVSMFMPSHRTYGRSYHSTYTVYRTRYRARMYIYSKLFKLSECFACDHVCTHKKETGARTVEYWPFLLRVWRRMLGSRTTSTSARRRTRCFDRKDAMKRS